MTYDHVVPPRAVTPASRHRPEGPLSLPPPNLLRPHRTRFADNSALSLNSAITWLTITPSGMVTDRYRFRWRSLPGFDHSSRLGKPELIDRGELHPADLRVAVATADPRTHRARSAAQPILPVHSCLLSQRRTVVDCGS